MEAKLLSERLMAPMRGGRGRGYTWMFKTAPTVSIC